MGEIVFLVCLVLFLILLGLIGFFIAISANGKISRLTTRLEEMERLLKAMQNGDTFKFSPSPQMQPSEAPVHAASEDFVVVEDKPAPEVSPAAENESAFFEDKNRVYAGTENAPSQKGPEALKIAASAAGEQSEAKGKAPAMGLEERLGTRWAVWIGGIALALGGIFVARYSIERGWFGPGARIAFGALFSIVLIACGEWLRRKELVKAIVGIPSAHIPGIVTAAGTTSIFATVYAAYGLYHFIGPATAFILLGLISVATMLASALHGPTLAALGLVAALIAPVLVSTGKAEFWPVVVYLVFAVGAAYGLARLRWWRWLALSGAGGALIWGGIFLFGQRGDITPAIGHIVIQTVMAAFIMIIAPYHSIRRDEGSIDYIACLTLTLFGCLAALIAVEPLTGAARVPLAAATAFGFLYLAWRYAQAVPLVCTSLLVCFGTLLFWPYLSAVSNDPLQALAVTPVERENLPSFLSFAIGSGIILAVAGYFKVGRDHADSWKRSLWFIGSATAGPLVLLILCYWRVTAFDHSLPFATVSASIALAFTIATTRLRRLPSGSETDTPSLATGAAASAAVAGLALGLTMALDKGVLTVSLALTALGVAVISEKIALPVLRYLVAALGLVVLGRLLWNPLVVPRGEIGDLPIFNWLLWGYGVPALSFLLSARILERHERDRVVRLVEGLGFVFVTFLIFFEIRHQISGNILRASTSLPESGLLATASLALGILMIHLRRRGDEKFYDRAANIYRILSLAGILIVLIPENPYIADGWGPVSGGPILNDLVLGYLLPGFLAAIFAWKSQGKASLLVVRLTATAALVLLTVYILLQIRLLFHLYEGFEGSGISMRISEIGYEVATGEAEQWCYSLALLVIGLVLLGTGFLRDMLSARIAALVYLVAVTAKVFIFDLANLAGLIRGLSFIGLGAVLVAIGYVYQNVHLAKRRKLSEEKEDAQPKVP